MLAGLPLWMAMEIRWSKKSKLWVAFKSLCFRSYSVHLKWVHLQNPFYNYLDFASIDSRRTTFVRVATLTYAFTLFPHSIWSSKKLIMNKFWISKNYPHFVPKCDRQKTWVNAQPILMNTFCRWSIHFSSKIFQTFGLTWIPLPTWGLSHLCAGPFLRFLAIVEQWFDANTSGFVSFLFSSHLFCRSPLAAWNPNKRNVSPNEVINLLIYFYNIPIHYDFTDFIYRSLPNHPHRTANYENVQMRKKIVHTLQHNEHNTIIIQSYKIVIVHLLWLLNVCATKYNQL